MANKILYAPETALSFRDSGGDAVLTLINLGFGAGQISARYDRGAGSKPGLAEVRGIMQWQSAPIAGEVAEIYISQSDGTNADGVVGTTAAALTAGQISNLGNPVCIVKAQTTATATDNIHSEKVLIWGRYISVGVVNRSAGDNLQNTSNASEVIITFYSLEIQ